MEMEVQIVHNVCCNVLDMLMVMLFNQIILFGISLFRQMALYSFGNKKLEDVENVYQASLMYKLLSDNEEDMMILYKKGRSRTAIEDTKHDTMFLPHSNPFNSFYLYNHYYIKEGRN